MTDTERLDWLLEHEAVVHMGPNGGHWVQYPMTNLPTLIPTYEQAEYYGMPREAIDAAMAEKGDSKELR